jgi:hypothetical protein
MKATNKAMSELHGNLAKILSEEIQKTQIDKEGNVVRSAAILNVARQFLKDNGIESIGEANEEMKELKAAFLPFDQIEDELRNTH